MIHHLSKGNEAVVSKMMTEDSGNSQFIPCGDTSSPGHATIKLIRDGDLIRGFDIQCSCGSVTTVSCIYE